MTNALLRISLIKSNRVIPLIVPAVFCVSAARAVTIETVPVGNPGNAADTERMSDATTGYGSVAYRYRIGKYEVTNAQYTEFLNGVDPTGANVLALYDSNMSSDAHGGINFNGAAGNGSKYDVKPGRDINPVVFVSWYDSVRFANWLNNGQGSGDTENGAYTLLGGVPTPSNGNSIARNARAKWWLPSEDEWYKAAFHKNDGISGSYWDYATSSDTVPYSDQPPGSDAPDPSNTANFFRNDRVANGYDDGYAVAGSFVPPENPLSDVGAYTFSTSPYGTFDQAGNIIEWNELPGVRGGAAVFNDFKGLHASLRGRSPRTKQDSFTGFRVASIVPEPSTIVLLGLGVLLLTRHPRRSWP